MYLRIISDFITKNLAEEISYITDRATLNLKGIKYDKKNGQVSLPIERLGLYRKRGFFKRHDRSIIIPSIIVVNNVTDCKIECNCKDISSILLLFGLKVKDNEIALCSADEVSGYTCYMMELKVSKIDLEIKDVEISKKKGTDVDAQ